MDGKRGLHRLFRWGRVCPQPSVIDAADVGTAFGLDLAIDEASGNALSSNPKAPQASGQTPQLERPKRR